ncbi:hypothetical protein MSAN_01383500 [Mycena sanguinolenta]|uniref:Uncharacterized protein n=1 Tax=Mycena sanguinolenta TaxID=230812 RepID=A0A8H6Y7K7_9AGAR|nr:hypothetical protein MSAN_01383500 [Mycena sanguinolenta]
MSSSEEWNPKNKTGNDYIAWLNEDPTRWLEVRRLATELAREEVCWGPQPRTVNSIYYSFPSNADFSKLAELRMYALSWAIRSKPEWQRKSSDPIIVEKWRKEALDQQKGLMLEQKLTPNMINYVLTELAGYGRLSEPATGIESGPFDAIWYSDRLISNELSDRLRAATAELENSPDNLKDWHPRSNGQVLDLVHPSLYCVVYGRTRYSNLTMPEPPPCFNPPEVDDDWTKDHIRKMDSVSPRFCWLPSDFSIDTTDGSAKLISPYINNLHPTKHKAMYRVIESALSSFVPLFEHVLSQINGQDKDIFRDIPPGSGRMKTKMTYGTWAGYNSKSVGETIPCIWSEGEVQYEDGMTDAEYEKLCEEAPKVLPEAHEEYTGELEKTIAPYSLRGRTIQCIIKLANIHLTPEKSRIQRRQLACRRCAMLNEHIVASGIYYYDEENISESRLAFRVTTGAPTYHVQDDEMCMDILYGLKRDTHCCQDLGSIATPAGRALAWPNVYQHCVAPFRLLDPSKSGHRKILAIFLVDPSIEPIPSATNIPPQQADWILDTMQEAQGDPNSLFSRLPLELLCSICDRLPGTFMTRQEAEGYRLELMDERTSVGKERAKELSYTFNMCEH